MIAGTWESSFSTFDLFFAKLTPNGGMDSAFGSNGFILVPMTGNEMAVHDLVQQNDDKFVLTGRGNGAQSGSLALVRFLPDGSLDPSFGGDGSHSSFIAKVSHVTDTNYATWIGGFGVAASEQDYEDDPDEGGLSNLLEYAFDFDPGDAASRDGGD